MNVASLREIAEKAATDERAIVELLAAHGPSITTKRPMGCVCGFVGDGTSPYWDAYRHHVAHVLSEFLDPRVLALLDMIEEARGLLTDKTYAYSEVIQAEVRAWLDRVGER